MLCSRCDRPERHGEGEQILGPVVREPNEPVFHTPGEGRVFGMVLFVVTLFGRNIDAFRFAKERLPREVYLSGYYKRWLAALESELVQARVSGPDEVDDRIFGRASPTTHGAPSAASGGDRSDDEFSSAPAFSALVRRASVTAIDGYFPSDAARPALPMDDHVQVRDHRAAGHTRQPGYVTGKPGVVVAHLGSTAFPDARAVRRRADHSICTPFRSTPVTCGRCRRTRNRGPGRPL